MKLSSLFLLLPCLLICISAQAKSSQAGRIYFDSKLSSQERAAISGSLAYLDQHQLLNADPKLLKAMNIQKGDARTVRAWLEARVQYIINASFSASKLFTISATHNFENPGVLPKQMLDGASKGGVVMANIGSLIYLLGKKTGSLKGLQANGIGTIAFTSPRAGVLMIGDGFLGMVPSSQPNTASSFQLISLLHEARHSDGNGPTTGFLHAKCPAGHDYANQSACDNNQNGPYLIDALAQKAFMLSCAQCSTTEKNTMRILYLDSLNRVIPDSSNWNDAPEGRR